MTVTYVKDKAKTKTTTKAKAAKDDAIKAAASAMLDIDTALGPHRAEVDILTKAYSDAKKNLESLLELPADESLVIVVAEGMVTVGPQANKTTVTEPEKVHDSLEAVKPGLFVELASVTLANLKKYLSGVEFEAITKTIQNGARRVTLKHKE